MIGEKFGRLVVEAKAPHRVVSGRKRIYWQVRCECGESREVSSDHLRSGHTRSCGCLVLGEQISGKESSRRYRERHPDRVKASQDRFRQGHPDRVRQIKRKWRMSNPELTLAQRHLRIARQAKVLTIEYTPGQLDQRMSMFGYRCWICGGGYEQVDHVKPISKGGPHILANLRPACAQCNQSKGAKWPFVNSTSVAS